jgi:PAS domain S-box-containing protein
MERRTNPEPHPDGGIAWHGYRHGITKRKQAEAEKQRLLNILEESADFIGSADMQGKLLYYNRAARRMVGLPEDTDLAAMHISDIHPLWATKQIRETAIPIIQEHGVWRGESAILHRDGREIPVYQVMVMHRGADGKPEFISTIMQDITERKQMENALHGKISDLKKTERDLRESRYQLRALAARMESVREEESKRIAREIHDELGQLLTALQINVYVLQMQFCADDPQLSAHIETMMSKVDQLIKVSQYITARLRPAALDMGVVSALEWLVDGFTERTGIHCELQIDEENLSLNKQWETAVFRIVQESLTNITRHAAASHVKVSLKYDENNYRLEVSDNGNGFDPKQKKKKSFGLLGIKERVWMCGGELDIVSAPSQGTTLKIRIPILQKQINTMS